MFEKIEDGRGIVALIIRSGYHSEGIEFFTPDNFSQQLAYMNRPAGYCIAPHVHNKVPREVFFTQEVLYVKKGKLKVDLYDKERNFLCEKVLVAGDIILLASGGHGFEMIEDSEIIEVKQGPYAGEHDKTRFKAEKDGSR